MTDLLGFIGHRSLAIGHWPSVIGHPRGRRVEPAEYHCTGRAGQRPRMANFDQTCAGMLVWLRPLDYTESSSNSDPRARRQHSRSGLMAESEEDLKRFVEAGAGIHVVRRSDNCRGWNNIRYKVGLSAKNVGAKKLSMNVAT